jgi:hypothetical protein
MLASVPQSRVIALQGGLNFRDLGGYSGASGRLTRWRHLFRSSGSIPTSWQPFGNAFSMVTSLHVPSSDSSPDLS